MNTVKNIVIGLFVLAGLAVGGFLLYVAESKVLAILGMVVSVAVAPIALGIALVIFLVVGWAQSVGNAIREGVK